MYHTKGTFMIRLITALFCLLANVSVANTVHPLISAMQEIDANVVFMRHALAPGVDSSNTKTRLFGALALGGSAVGTSGQVLTSQGSGTAPIWTTPSSASGLPTGGTAGQILSKIDSTNYNAQWIDNYATQVKMQAKNTTGSTLAKGTVVYISGASGANPFMAPAQADSDLTSATTIGILESTVANNGFGLIVETGVISGIDTSLATEGDPVWLSGTTAGGMIFGIANKPHAPIHLVYLGTVTRAHAVNGEIQVKVNNGWELEELHDVLISAPVAYNMLRRNSANTLWENIPGPAGAVVGTTDTQTLTNKTIDGSSNTLSNIGNSSLTNSSITVNGTAVPLGGSVTVGTAATAYAYTWFLA